MTDNFILIPWQEIAVETLDNLIAEFVTRDGTDYGCHEVSTEQKVDQVKSLLKIKHYVIVFDTDAQQSNIVTMEAWRNLSGA